MCSSATRPDSNIGKGKVKLRAKEYRATIHETYLLRCIPIHIIVEMLMEGRAFNRKK